MIYLLYSSKTHNIVPEVTHMNGVTIQMTEGWFIFDTESTKLNWHILNNNALIEIDSDKFKIREQLIFKNKIKAESTFLRLKLEEMNKNGLSYFTPKLYKTIESNLEKLYDEFPESII